MQLLALVVTSLDGKQWLHFYGTRRQPVHIILSKGFRRCYMVSGYWLILVSSFIYWLQIHFKFNVGNVRMGVHGQYFWILWHLEGSTHSMKILLALTFHRHLHPCTTSGIHGGHILPASCLSVVCTGGCWSPFPQRLGSVQSFPGGRWHLEIQTKNVFFIMRLKVFTGRTTDEMFVTSNIQLLNFSVTKLFSQKCRTDMAASSWIRLESHANVNVTRKSMVEIGLLGLTKCSSFATWPFLPSSGYISTPFGHNKGSVLKSNTSDSRQLDCSSFRRFVRPKPLILSCV